MKKASLIGHVIELHDMIRGVNQPVDNIVRDFFRQRHYLGSKDRRFITDTIYGMVRNFRILEVFAVETLSRIGGSTLPPTVPSISLYAVFSARLLREKVDLLIPDLSVQWQNYLPKLDCATFLDALMVVQIPDSIRTDITQRIAITYSFPESIVNEWVERFGPEEAEQLCISLNQQAPITIRVNTLKTTVEQCRDDLSKEGIGSERTKLSPFGLILTKRTNTQALEIFKNGYFEMQDEGSQLLSMLLEPYEGECVVDACAGSGGKALHIAAMMKNQGSLLALEVDGKRFGNVRQRIRRSGVSIAHLRLVRHNENVVGWEKKADKVLVDARCSGVGIFRRNPGAKLTFKEEFVESLSRTQLSLLEKYKDMVRPRGRLVYTTCTLLKKENEDVVNRFLGNNPGFSLLSAPEILMKQGVHIGSNASQFLTLLPHMSTTDGFFAAVMMKREEDAR